MSLVAPRHRAQLFDTADSLANAVVPFIREGLVNGDAVLVVVTHSHWDLIRRRSQELPGCDVDAARREGWLTVMDAEQVVEDLLAPGLPTWSDFDATVGAVVRDLRRKHGTLRIFGEAVDVLARQNRFEAAETLEQLWNWLGIRETFTLFCAYSAEHFGNPRDAASLRRICHLHTHAHAETPDVLGSFLLKHCAAC